MNESDVRMIMLAQMIRGCDFIEITHALEMVLDIGDMELLAEYMKEHQIRRYETSKMLGLLDD